MPLFGGTVQPKANVLGSIFGSNNADQNSGWDSAKSIFGGGQQQKNEAASKSIFGGAKVESPQQPPSIKAPEVPKSIFGGAPSVFGGTASSGFVFGSGTNAPIFGQNETVSSFADLSKQDKEQEEKQTTASTPFSGFGFGGEAKEGKKDPLSFASPTTGSTTFVDFGSKAGETFADFAKKAGGNDFADLSAKSQGTPVGFNKSSGGGFYNLTHQNEFKNFQSTPQSAKNESQGDEDGDANNDDNYDPQYDPIIELPDEIVVTTGEENETKLFGERVKLFRYDSDTKAWKERGE